MRNTYVSTPLARSKIPPALPKDLKKGRSASSGPERSYTNIEPTKKSGDKFTEFCSRSMPMWMLSRHVSSRYVRRTGEGEKGWRTDNTQITTRYRRSHRLRLAKLLPMLEMLANT